MSPPMLPSVKESAIQGSNRVSTRGRTCGMGGEIIVQPVRPGVHQRAQPGGAAAIIGLERGRIDPEPLAQILPERALAFRFGQCGRARSADWPRCAGNRPRPGRRSRRTRRRRRSTPRTWAMPQSSRVMVTRAACALPPRHARTASAARRQASARRSRSRQGSARSGSCWPQSRKTSPAWMTRKPPSAKRRRSAPLSSRPSNRPSPSAVESGVPSGWAAASQAARTGARPSRAPAAEPGGRSRRRAARAKASGRAPAAAPRLVGGPVEIVGMMGEVDAEAEDHRIALALEQDAGELGAVDEQVVGPFDPRSRAHRATTASCSATAATRARVGARRVARAGGGPGCEA